MPKKKKHGPEELSEQEKLNRRVDAMMDPKRPDESPDPPPLDIFKDAKTAPELPGKLAGKVDKEVSEPAAPVKPAPAEPKPEPQEAPKDPVGKKDPLDDKATDAAVNDIAAKESNTLLALQDAIGHKATRVAGNLAQQDRKKARLRHWLWLIFIVVFIILVLLALPFDSYTCHWPIAVHLRVTTDILPSVCK